MSLDDIIKKERADRNKRTPAARRGFASKRGGVGVKRGVGMRRNIRGGMRGASSSSSWNNRTKPQTSINKNKTNNSQRSLRSSNNNLNKVATMRMVQKLVKKAINQRANQTIIQRAGVSNQRNRRANLLTRRRVIGARVPLTKRRVGVASIRTTSAVARRNLNNVRTIARLRGVNQRSRVVMGSAARRRARLAQQQHQINLINTVNRQIRGRGVSRFGQLVSDQPVVYERQTIEPMNSARMGSTTQFVRQLTTMPMQRQRGMVQREVIVEDDSDEYGSTSTNKPVIITRTPFVRTVAPSIRRRRVGNMNGGTVIQRRANIQQQQQRFIVNGGGRGRVAKQYRTQRVIEIEQPEPQRVQRVRYIRSVRDRSMNAAANNANANRSIRNARLRDAFGITKRTRQQNEPRRFESSTQFLQRVPIRRGRGFRSNNSRFVD